MTESKKVDSASNTSLAAQSLSSPLKSDCGGTTATSSGDGDNAFSNSTNEPCVIGATLRFQVTLRKDAFGLGIYFSESADGRAVVDPALPFYRLPDDGEAPGERSRAIAPGDALCAIDGRTLETLAFAAVVDELRRLGTGVVTLTFERLMPARMAALTLQPNLLSSQSQENDDQETWSRCGSNNSKGTEGRIVSDVHVSNRNEPKQEESEVTNAKQQQQQQHWRVFQRLSAVTAGGNGAASATDTSSMGALEQLVLEMEERLQAADAALEREKKCRFLAEKKNILYRNELLRLSGENSAMRYDLSRHQSASKQREDFCLGNLHLAI